MEDHAAHDGITMITLVLMLLVFASWGVIFKESMNRGSSTDEQEEMEAWRRKYLYKTTETTNQPTSSDQNEAEALKATD